MWVFFKNLSYNYLFWVNFCLLLYGVVLDGYYICFSKVFGYISSNIVL